MPLSLLMTGHRSYLIEDPAGRSKHLKPDLVADRKWNAGTVGYAVGAGSRLCGDDG
jgi:hypothetical protein